jgi:hypothetical protein
VDSDLINVRFGPLCGLKSDISCGPGCAKTGCEQSQQGGPLFDHLVGDGKHAWRNGQAESLRGLDVDDELKFARLHDR